jgi:protein-tyrosine phosphatase
MNILFVCTGNISRSFLAETLLKNEVSIKRVPDIYVSSAGTIGLTGLSSDPEMVKYLKERGIDAKNHTAKEIGEDHIKWADLILVMEDVHVEYITSKWPQAKGKIEKLGKYISPDQTEDDIIDPYGKTAFYYRLAQSQITLAVGNLIQRLVSASVKN